MLVNEADITTDEVTGAVLAVVAGDSHCLAFDGVSDATTPLLKARAAFCSSPAGFFARAIAVPEAGGTLRAAPLLRKVIGEAIALDAPVRRSLLRAAASLWGGSRRRRSADGVAASRRAERIVVLTLGGSDCVVETMNAIWEQYDFLLPEFPDLHDSTRDRLPGALVTGWIERNLSLVAPAMTDLQASGFGPVAVLPPPPPHRDDAACVSHLRGRGIDSFIAPYALRAKIAWLYHEGLRGICYRAGIPFIDSWSFAADGLALKRAYEHDGFHANRAFAMACLPLIAAVVSPVARSS